MAMCQSIAKLDTLLESESQTLDVSFFDEDDAPATPNQAVYRVIDPLTNTVIRDDVQLTPATTISILLAPPDTTIVNDTYHKEKRRVIVTAEYAGGDITRDTWDFFVRNVKTLP